MLAVNLFSRSLQIEKSVEILLDRKQADKESTTDRKLPQSGEVE